MKIRIIPRLDIKGPNLVKGMQLEGLRVMGQPESFTRHYYEAGADELVYQDVVASLYGRSSLHELITRVARTTFIPLTVGGGLRSVADIRQVLRCGADKVSLNTAAIKDPQLIEQASRTFGSSTIVVTIEAIKQTDGSYWAFVNNGREHTGIEVVSWAKRVQDLGAGEIFLTSVDREGTGRGFDLQLLQAVVKAVEIPVVAHGGAGRLEHFNQAIDTGVAAVACASMLHYDFIHHKDHASGGAAEGNTTFLSKGGGFAKVKATGLKELKDHLLKSGVDCRPADNSTGAQK